MKDYLIIILLALLILTKYSNALEKGWKKLKSLRLKVTFQECERKDTEQVEKQEKESQPLIIKKSSYSFSSSKENNQKIGQTLPNDAMSQTSDNQNKKEDTFAKQEDKKSAEIPSEKLDKVFQSDSLNEDNELDINIESGSEDDFEDETLEDKSIVLSRRDGEVETADGFSYEQMSLAAKGAKGESEESECAEVLYKMQGTDMFEQFLLTEHSKKISELLDQQEQALLKRQSTDESVSDEVGDFDITGYIK